MACWKLGRLLKTHSEKLCVVYLLSLLNTVDVEYVLWATQFNYTQPGVWRCIVHWYSEVTVLFGVVGGWAARELWHNFAFVCHSLPLAASECHNPIR